MGSELLRTGIGGLLLAVGVCVSTVVSFVAYSQFYAYLHRLGQLTSLETLLVPGPGWQLLVSAATGATSGLVLVGFAVSAAYVKGIDSRDWPFLTSVWLLWVFVHVAVWLFGVVFV
jgi:hypothetical protein